MIITKFFPKIAENIIFEKNINSQKNFSIKVFLISFVQCKVNLQESHQDLLKLANLYQKNKAELTLTLLQTQKFCVT